MVQVELVTGAFFSMLVFITFALRFELDLTLVISAMLSVSVMAVGVMLAATVQYFTGLSMRWTAMVLALMVFLLALAYEAVS